MLLDRIIYRTDFMFEICFKNTYYGLVSYPSVFNAFLLKEPSVLFRRVFLCEKDSFHYPTFFEDLDGFDGINRRMKKSAEMQFKCN